MTQDSGQFHPVPEGPAQYPARPAWNVTPVPERPPPPLDDEPWETEDEPARLPEPAPEREPEGEPEGEPAPAGAFGSPQFVAAR